MAWKWSPGYKFLDNFTIGAKAAPFDKLRVLEERERLIARSRNSASEQYNRRFDKLSARIK